MHCLMHIFIISLTFIKVVKWQQFIKTLWQNNFPCIPYLMQTTYLKQNFQFKKEQELITATKVRKQVAVASYSETTQLTSSFIKFNPYFWLISAFTYLPKVGIKLYRLASQLINVISEQLANAPCFLTFCSNDHSYPFLNSKFLFQILVCLLFMFHFV